MPSAPPAHREIRPLSALRGVAALWVLLYHLSGMAPPVLLPDLAANAWTGVDIFFILSGYVLTAAYGADARADLVGFYAKRVCRLYPLHISVMLGLAAMVLAAPHIGLRLTNDRFHAWSNFPVVLLLLQPYLPEQGQWWNAPSWSAAVELACYAAFPFLVPMLCRLRPTGRLALMAAAVLLQIWLQYDATEGVYVGLPSLARGASGFVLGILLHNLVRGWRPGVLRASLLEVLGLGGIAASCGFGAPYMVQVFGALLVAVFSRDIGAGAHLLRNGSLVWLGRISFSVYLLHEPVMALLLKLLPPGGAAEAALTPIGHRLVLVAIVVAASSLTYMWIEAPGQRLPSRLFAGI
jgi:peptidoglycan/LPS O-acetylase OafA/YrhL